MTARLLVEVVKWPGREHRRLGFSVSLGKRKEQHQESEGLLASKSGELRVCRGEACSDRLAASAGWCGRTASNGYSFFLSPVEHMSGGDRAADRRDFVGFPASREVANDTSFVGETPSGMSDGSVFAAVICAGRRSFAR